MLDKLLRCLGVSDPKASRPFEHDDADLIERHDAAATIQRHVRAHQATGRDAREREETVQENDADERKRAAASTIASKVRGHRARVTFAELKEQARAAQEIEAEIEEAELDAEAEARAQAEAAREAERMAEELAERMAQKEAGAATRLQAHARAWLARARSARRREDRLLEERKASAQAATSIARVARGRHVRAVEAPLAKLTRARAHLQQLPPLKKGSRQLPGFYMVRTVTLARDHVSLVYSKPGRSDPRATTHLRLAEMDAIIVQGEDTTIVMHFEPEPYVFRAPSTDVASAFGRALDVCVRAAKLAESPSSGSGSSANSSRVAVLRKDSEKVPVGVTFQYVKKVGGGGNQLYAPHAVPAAGPAGAKPIEALPPVLREVAPKSLAASAGLRVGDLVAAINGVPISTNVQAAEMLRQAVGEVELLVRPAEFVQVPIEHAAPPA